MGTNSGDEDSSKQTQSSFPSGGLQLNRRPSVQFNQELGRRASCTNPLSHLCKQLEERAYLVGEGRIKVLLLTKLAPLMHSNDLHSTIQRFLLLHMLRVYLADWDPQVRASALRCLRYSIRGRQSLDILTKMRIPEFVAARLEAGKTLAERAQALKVVARWLQFDENAVFVNVLRELAGFYPDDPLREKALVMLIFAVNRHPGLCAHLGAMNELIETGILNHRFNGRYGKVAAEVLVHALINGERPELRREMRAKVALERLVSPLLAIRKSHIHGDMRGVLEGVLRFVSTFSGLVLLSHPLTAVFQTHPVMPDAEGHRTELVRKLIDSIESDARGIFLCRLLSVHVNCPELLRKRAALRLDVDACYLLAAARKGVHPAFNADVFSKARKSGSAVDFGLTLQAAFSSRRFTAQYTAWKSVLDLLEGPADFCGELVKCGFLHELTAFFVATGFTCKSEEVPAVARALIRLLLIRSSDSIHHGLDFNSSLIPALMSGLNAVLEMRPGDANGAVLAAAISELTKSEAGVLQLDLYNVPSLLCGLVEHQIGLVCEVMVELAVPSRLIFTRLFDLVLTSGLRRLRAAAIASQAAPTQVLVQILEQSFLEEDRQACVAALVRRVRSEPTEAGLIVFKATLAVPLVLSLIEISASHLVQATESGWLQNRWLDAIETLNEDGPSIDLFRSVLCSDHGQTWVLEDGIQLIISLRGLLEDGETSGCVFEVLELMHSVAPSLLVKLDLISHVQKLLHDSDDLAQVERCWNLISLTDGNKEELFKVINRFTSRPDEVDDQSDADLSAYSDDPDQDLSPASVGQSGRGGSFSQRRSTLKRCMTQNDFGRFAEMRMSIGSSSDDSELQMMEVERLSVASPDNFTVAPIRRFGERHREVFRRIVSLTNPVMFKNSQSSLIKTKQHDPQLFYSVGLWLRVQKALAVFKFALNARKFIHMLFESTFADPESLPYLDRLK
jgi:hypothetical protein